jgi:hypothetical protein
VELYLHSPYAFMAWCSVKACMINPSRSITYITVSTKKNVGHIDAETNMVNFTSFFDSLYCEVKCPKKITFIFLFSSVHII